MMEAGCTIIGGHSIRDEETKFGYSITGLIHPKRVLQNAGAKPGDKLVLTKAIGTGVISTAIKKEKAKQKWIEAAIQSMTTLNKKAAEVITKIANDQRPTTDDAFAVHSMTDITGFGLIGHAREILLASNVSMTIHASKVPILEGALDCIQAGHIPGGLNNNRNFAECMVEYDDDVAEDLRTILYDPQTAGGLLICTPEGEALTQALNQAGVPAVQIGEVHPNTKPRIRVTD